MSSLHVATNFNLLPLTLIYCIFNNIHLTFVSESAEYRLPKSTIIYANKLFLVAML